MNTLDKVIDNLGLDEHQYDVAKLVFEETLKYAARKKVHTGKSMSNIKLKIAKFVAEDMEQFFSLACDVHLQSFCGGLGGCKHFEIEAFPAKFRKYLLEYFETDKTACECFTDYLYDNRYLAG